jgi:DHA1 family tetracycline resistance protein-like MFS transporter
MKFRCLDLPIPVVFFTILLNALGFGILIPIIPLLLADPKSQYFMLPHSFSLGQGYIIFGFLVAIYPLMQFMATPILGQLSDKFGRKKILAISLAGTFISYILFAIGILLKNIPLLFISRAFDGITGGNISVAQAVVADVTPPQKEQELLVSSGQHLELVLFLVLFLVEFCQNQNL